MSVLTSADMTILIKFFYVAKAWQGMCWHSMLLLVPVPAFLELAALKILSHKTRPVKQRACNQLPKRNLLNKYGNFVLEKAPLTPPEEDHHC